MQRLERERRTLTAMICIFCRDRHASQGALCSGCAALLEYALSRLERCPFREKKPACANCIVHCYQIDRREHIRAVMRHAGPRMFRYHPLLAFGHLLDSLRRAEKKANG